MDARSASSQLPRGATASKWIVGLCFLFSGATGLIYQSIWVRITGLFYGNTTLAVSAVLTAFMSGLAIGAWAIGSRADGLRRPLAAYGILEALIGFYGIASPWLLSKARSLYVATVVPRDLPEGTLALAQFAICLVILVLPTALMGATLPILSAGLHRVLGSTQKTVGSLYAINTFGAVLGTFLTGFVLLPLIGVNMSVLTAAITNVAIGVVVVALSAIVGEGMVGEPRAPVPVAEEPRPAGEEPRVLARHIPVRLIMVSFFCTGLAALTLEVAWTRTLCMFLGSSVYGFAIILTSFLLGLALGSWIFAVVFARRPVYLETFGSVACGIGLICLVLSAVYPYLPYVFLGLYTGFTFMELAVLYTLQFAVCLSLVILPTCLMGMTFPIVAKVCTDKWGRLGDAVGKSYAANTAGAIAGSALSGLLFIPVLGLQRTIIVFSLLYVAVGVINMVVGPLRRSARSAGTQIVTAAAVVAVAVVVTAALPPWRKAALVSGVFRHNYQTADGAAVGVAQINRDEDTIVFYREGTSCTVSVIADTWGKALAVNGKTDASTLETDMVTQQLTGHLPVLLQDTPGRALLIGLGSGCSAAALCAHEDVQLVEVAELEPQVAEGARLMSEVNRGILEPGVEPKFRLRFMDGRTTLLGSEGIYDIVISEPSNPWISGVSNLFTVQHYEACKRALKPTGLFCQWAQGYDLDRETLHMMFATIQSVFPNASVWATTQADFLFIARADDAPVDYERLVRKFATNQLLREDLEPYRHASPGGILACYRLGPLELARAAQGGAINTDDHPLLEFWAPRGLYQPSETSNFEWVMGFRDSELPEMINFHPTDEEWVRIRCDMASALLQKGVWREAKANAGKALAMDPRCGEAYMLLGEAERELGHVLACSRALRRAVTLMPKDVRPRIALADLQLSQGAPEAALETLKPALDVDPNNRAIKDVLDRAFARLADAAAL